MQHAAVVGPSHDFHEVLPGLAPIITRTAMASLAPDWVTAGSTLYIHAFAADLVEPADR